MLPPRLSRREDLGGAAVALAAAWSTASSGSACKAGGEYEEAQLVIKSSGREANNVKWCGISCAAAIHEASWLLTAIGEAGRFVGRE